MQMPASPPMNSHPPMQGSFKKTYPPFLGDHTTTSELYCHTDIEQQTSRLSLKI